MKDLTFVGCACSGEIYRVSLQDPSYVVLECAGCKQRLRIKREQRCTYEHQTLDILRATAAPNAVMCAGSASEIVHDQRGCRLVCAAHAAWRSRMSRCPGHSTDCPEAGLGDKL